jgi:hypothetical protein
LKGTPSLGRKTAEELGSSMRRTEELLIHIQLKVVNFKVKAIKLMFL